MRRRIKKYFNPLSVADEISLRFHWMISKIMQGENLRFLEKFQSMPQPRPIFIIGPPRCGSTLLYQALVHQFKFSYFQNRMKKYKYSICLYTERHIDPLKIYKSDFWNRQGNTRYSNGPHEGGFFWRRFYPRNIHDYIGEHSFSPIQVFEIINTIKFLENYFHAPFLSKNLEMGIRLKSIQQLFPGAVFIVMKRDPRSIASSLVSSRIAVNGRKEVWWSVRPREYEQLLNKPYHEQIAYQIISIYQAIYNDFNAQSGTMIELFYEDLCENPMQSLTHLQYELENIHISLESKHLKLPEKFSLKTRLNFSKKELMEITELFIKEGLVEKVPFRMNGIR